MKKCIFPLLAAGVIAGTLFVNFLGITLVRQSGVFDNNYFMRIYSVTLEENGLLRYIMGARLKELAVAVLLSMTPLAVVILAIIVFLWAFVQGMLSSICVIQQGIPGFLMFLLMSVPMYVMFYPGLFCLYGRVRLSHGRHILQYVLIGILLAMFSSFFETYLFVHVIKAFALWQK